MKMLGPMNVKNYLQSGLKKLLVTVGYMGVLKKVIKDGIIVFQFL